MCETVINVCESGIHDGPKYAFDGELVDCKDKKRCLACLTKLFGKKELSLKCQSSLHKPEYNMKIVQRCKDDKIRCCGCIIELQKECKKKMNAGISKKPINKRYYGQTCPDCTQFVILTEQCLDDVFRCSKCRNKNIIKAFELMEKTSLH